MNAPSKPYLTFEEQLARLQARGLLVTDEPLALEHLRRVGYYRLSAYWHPMRRVGADGVRLDEFLPGARFSDVIELYVFDKRLRALLGDALERIEIALRVAIAHHLGSKNPTAHVDPALFDARFARRYNARGTTDHEEWLCALNDSIRRSREDFVSHYRLKYGEIFPIWVTVELWDFGMMSRLFSGMRVPDRDHIAHQFELPHGRMLESWIRTLNLVRNVTAHHARLWNKAIPFSPVLERAPDELRHCTAAPSLNRVYVSLCLCAYLLNLICPRSSWRQRVCAHLQSLPAAPSIAPSAMGVPDGWHDYAIWSRVTTS